MSGVSRRSAVVARLWPWLTLVTGMLSAVLMSRAPERAWLVASAAGAGWLSLALFLFLERFASDDLASARPWWRWARFSAKSSTQSLTQLSLFFPAPFYWDAASRGVGHGFFLVLLALAASLTLWEPLYLRLVAHRFLGAALQAFAAFVGLNAALPMLGVSNQTSLLVAALGAAGGPAFAAGLAVPGEARRWTVLRHAAAGALIPGALALGAAALLPPAPLVWVEGAMGTRLQDRWVEDPASVRETVPTELVCASAIRAPRGLRDKIFHVWRHNGETVDRVAVTLGGGQPFRTYSRKQNLGADPRGRWACLTETASGQRLGESALWIGGHQNAGGVLHAPGSGP